MEYLFLGLSLFYILLSAVVLFLHFKWPPQKKSRSQDSPKIDVHPTPVNINLEALERSISDVPGKVLQSIQGSVNTHKGALGELIGYMELRAKYDRIIPLGNIVDFVCIKFPRDDQEGCIDFVDVKTGSYSRLSKDQRQLKKLIGEKKLNFVEFRVTDNKVAGNEDIS